MRTMSALLWREAREVWWGFVAMVCLVAGGALYQVWVIAPHDKPVGDYHYVPFVILCGCGALLGGRAFAHDREDGTHAFVMRLPVEPMRVWTAKLIVAAAAFGGLFAFAAALEAFPRDPGPYRWVLAVPPALFAAAFLVSTVLDNSLLAAGGGATLFILALLAYMSTADPHTGHPDLTGADVSPSHAALVLALILVGLLAAIALSALAFHRRCRRTRV